MAASDKPILPEQDKASNRSIAPAFAAATQVQPYIPPDVWTPEAVIHFHDQQRAVLIDNNRIIDKQRGREQTQSLLGIALVCGIIIFGCWLTVKGNPFGKDIIGYTVFFLAGYLAGHGKKPTG